MKRRLATVLAADIVGFSRLMHADEAGTYERVTETIDRVNALLEARAGRVFKVMGDGVMAEFESVRLAVVAALEVQELLAEEEGPDAIRLRIGINLGDVIAHGDDLYGDGVNIAARIEALAPVGGILCTRPVRDQIRDHLQLTIEDLGEARVKNIRRPIRVFRLSRTPVSRTVAKPEPRRQSVRGAPLAGVAAVALLALLLSERAAMPPSAVLTDEAAVAQAARAAGATATDTATATATVQSVVATLAPPASTASEETTAALLPAVGTDETGLDAAGLDAAGDGLLPLSITGVVREETLAALDVTPVLEAPVYASDTLPSEGVAGGAGEAGVALRITFGVTGTWSHCAPFGDDRVHQLTLDAPARWQGIPVEGDHGMDLKARAWREGEGIRLALLPYPSDWQESDALTVSVDPIRPGAGASAFATRQLRPPLNDCGRLVAYVQVVEAP